MPDRIVGCMRFFNKKTREFSCGLSEITPVLYTLEKATHRQNGNRAEDDRC